VKRALRNVKTTGNGVPLPMPPGKMARALSIREGLVLLGGFVRLRGLDAARERAG